MESNKNPESGGPSHSNHHSQDHNRIVRDATPTAPAEQHRKPQDFDQDGQSLVFRAQSDALTDLPEMTPMTRKLHDMVKNSCDHSDGVPNAEETNATFFIRPKSSGTGPFVEGFTFAPAKHRTANLARPQPQRVPSTAPLEELGGSQVSGNRCISRRHSQSSELEHQPLLRSAENVRVPLTEADNSADFHGQQLVDKTKPTDDQNQASVEDHANMHILHHNSCHQASPPESITCDQKESRFARSASEQAIEVPSNHTVSEATSEAKGEDLQVQQPRKHNSELAIDASGTQNFGKARESSIPKASTVDEEFQETPPQPIHSRPASVSSVTPKTPGLRSRIANPVQRRNTPHANIQAGSADELLSDTDIVEVLIHRQRLLRAKARQDELTIHDHATKIRTLHHTVQQLERQQEQYERQLQDANAALAHVEDDRKLFEDKSNAFRARYNRIKDFARTIAGEMKALRQSAAEQTQISSELRRELAEVREECQMAVSKAHSLLQGQARKISSVKEDASAANQLIEHLRGERDANASLVDQERAKNRQLEGHITILERTQQTFHTAYSEANQEILQTLAGVKTQFQNLETCMKPDLQMVAECLKLLESLSSKDYTTLKELDQLKETLSKLDATMSTSIVRLEQACGDMHQEDPRGLEIMFKELRCALDTSTAKAEELRVAEQKLAGLEQKVKDDPKLIEELEQSRTDARAYAKSFQNATEKLLECMRTGQQNDVSQKIAWDDEVRKWQLQCETARSELAACRKRNGEVEAERNALRESVHGLQSKLNEGTVMMQSFDERVHDRDSQIAAFLTEVEHMKAEASKQREAFFSLETTIAEKTSEVRDISAKLDALKERHAQSEGQLQEHIAVNSALKKEHDSLTIEYQSLRREHQGTLKKLESAHIQLKSAMSQVERLKEQTEINIYKQQVATLRQDISSQEEVITSLTNQVKEGRTNGDEVLALRDELRCARDAHEKLEMSVKALTEESTKNQNLREHLHTMALTVEDLENKLAKANEREAQLKHIENETIALSQALQDAEARHNATLQQLQDRDNLADSVRQKEGRITALEEEIEAIRPQLRDQESLKAQLEYQTQTALDLQRQLEEMSHIRAALDQKKHECEEKDATIHQLKDEIARHKEETQLVDSLADQINDGLSEPGRVILPESRQTQGWEGQHVPEHIQQGLDRSIMIPEAALELGKDAAFLQEPQRGQQKSTGDSAQELQLEQPRRRVADRSGLMKPPKKMGNPNRGDLTPRSTDSTSVVPNSQLETPDVTLGFGEGGTSSSLSEIDESDLPSDIERCGGLKAGNARVQASNGLKSRKLADMRPSASPSERPTTAQTDLFNFHTRGLSSATDHVSNWGRTDISCDKMAKVGEAPGHAMYHLPETVSPRDVQIHSDDSLRRLQSQQKSPMRLRDGTQVADSGALSRNRPLTPQAGRGCSSGVAHTMVAPTRDMPQPNSAAKRRREQEARASPETRAGNSKRRQLEVSRAGAKEDKGIRRGSVIGTSAPTPGATKRGGKGFRKGTKSAKYEDRFGVREK